MSTEATAAPAGADQSAAPVSEVAIPTHVAGGAGPISVRDAARSVVDWRRKEAAGEDNNSGQDASAQQATPDPKESAQADNGEPQTPPVETESQDAEVETLPPVEPPRSWSKEDKELFKALPRETQERLAERERSRDTDFSRRQQEATERAKALETERGRVEQARSQYEHALPILLNNLQAAYQGEFSDIKTMDDVQKLAVTDPIRYTQWDASQKKMAAVQQEIVATQERQEAEYSDALKEYRRQQDALFSEKAPEMADAAKAKKMADGVVTVLRDLGFSNDELGQLFHGKRNVSIHDHRLQLLLRDSVNWRDAQAQAKAKTASAKPLPPVQRPGSTRGAAAAAESKINDLNKQLDGASGTKALRIAAQMLQTRRAAQQ